MDTTINTARDIIYSIAKERMARAEKGERVLNAPIACHSAPGVGKSAIMREVGEYLDVPVVDVRLSAMEAADVQGIPYVHEGEMRFSTPEWFPCPENGDSEYGILFFDEISNAPRAVQQAAYRAIWDRTIQNGKKLPAGWIIVAAGNRKEDKTGSGDLLPALANRFAAHINIRADVDDFLSYAAANGLHHHVQGYIAFSPKDLYNFDPKHNTEAAFPSPRSWEFVSEHLSMNLTDEQLSLALSGCIGEGAATKFMGFRKYYSKLPDFQKIISGEKEYKVPNDDEPGLIFALVSSLVVYSFQMVQDKNDQGLDNLGAVIEQIPDEYLTLYFKQIRSYFEANLPPDQKNSNEFTQVMRRSNKISNAFSRIRKFTKTGNKK